MKAAPHSGLHAWDEAVRRLRDEIGEHVLIDLPVHRLDLYPLDDRSGKTT